MGHRIFESYIAASYDCGFYNLPLYLVNFLILY